MWGSLISTRKKQGGTIKEESISFERYKELMTESRTFIGSANRLKEINKRIKEIEPKLAKYKKEIVDRFNRLTKMDQSQEFQTKYKTEELKYRTLRGDLVRSKNEGYIADALYINKIHYEYEMILPGLDIHPDFYIRDNIRGIPIIWEHFGLMSSVEYVKTYIRKLETYRLYGFIPGYNLICTYECTDDNKATNVYFDSMKAREIVSEWFLPEGVLSKQKNAA